MQPRSQKDVRWKDSILGTSRLTIEKAGCFVASLSMLSDIGVLKVNEMLKEGGGFADGNMIISEKAAKILGLDYKGRTTAIPESICIAETHDYTPDDSPNILQHFFVWRPDGMILDPLSEPESMDWIKNKYNIVSYRLFSEKLNVVIPRDLG